MVCTGNLIEDGDVDRHLVEEDSEASADCGSAVARGREDKADARSKVNGFGGKADMVEAVKAEIERQARIDLPAVLQEESEARLVGRL